MKTKSLIPLLTLSLFFSTTRAIYSISSSTHANTCPDQATNYFNIMNGMPQELYFSCHVTGDLHDVVVDDVDCLSWRVAVETNNVKDWEVIPATCIGYVASYMTKQQYDVDIKVVTKVAYDYAKSLKLQGDGKDIWVFDVGQTSISFLDYYSRPDVQFGALAYNATKFGEFSGGEEATKLAIPQVLELYKKLIDLGFEIVFVSATEEIQWQLTADNLHNAGYHGWNQLIMRKKREMDISSVREYKAKKRTELVRAGYRIRGNLGDQWSDLSPPNSGDRTFKLPNPMFYVP